MALTPTQEAVAIAVGNAFIAAGFTNEAQATNALVTLKLQNDLTVAAAALAAERGAWEAVGAQYAIDRSEAQLALTAAEVVLAAFVYQNQVLDATSALEYSQRDLDIKAAQAVMDDLEIAFAEAEADHVQTVSDLAAAVETAQAALDAHVSGG